jgi:Cu(I)/Ag(I) efflux system membrane fusion protein
MKWILNATAAIAIACVMAGCSKSTADQHAAPVGQKSYTCSMHPEIVRDSPGNCPTCGMALTEKK